MDTKLQSLVADILDMVADDVTAQLTQQSAEHWDSLNHLKLVTAVEEEFGVKFTMPEIESITSIGKLEALLKERAQSR